MRSNTLVSFAAAAAGLIGNVVAIEVDFTSPGMHSRRSRVRFAHLEDDASKSVTDMLQLLSRARRQQ